MKKLIITISLFCTFYCFSQKTEKTNFFFDENNIQITSLDYFKKCSSFLYLCKKESKDSIINYKIIELFKLGKLSNSETKKVQNQLSKYSNQNLINKTVVISYIDLIYGYKSSKTLPRDISFDTHFLFNNSKSVYKSNSKKNDLKQKKCIKKYSKLNSEILYLYDKNIDYSYTPKHYKWHKISTGIKSLLFDSKFPSILILKPNGNYFRYYVNHSKKALDYLISRDNWDQYFKDYEFAKNNYSEKKNGVFEEMEMKKDYKSLSIINNPNITKEEKIKLLQSSQHEFYKSKTSKNPCFSSARF